MAEAYNEFKLKSFELERLQLVFEEGNKNLKKCNLENAKLSRQKEVRVARHFKSFSFV